MTKHRMSSVWEISWKWQSMHGMAKYHYQIKSLDSERVHHIIWALWYRWHSLTACNTCKIQNGWRGLEKCLPLGFWALPATFAKYFFWSEHSFYEKSRRRKKTGGEKREDNVVYSGHLHHCQSTARTPTDWNANRLWQKIRTWSLDPPPFLKVCYYF